MDLLHYALFVLVILLCLCMACCICGFCICKRIKGDDTLADTSKFKITHLNKVYASMKEIDAKLCDPLDALKNKKNKPIKEVEPAEQAAQLDKPQLVEPNDCKEVQVVMHNNYMLLEDPPEQPDPQTVKPLRCLIIEFENNFKKFKEEMQLLAQIAKPTDEVVICIKSPGGGVIEFGVALCYIQELRKKKIRVVACVDEYAASGGYLLACACTKIYAAPMSIIGSIGVIAEQPNFYDLLRTLGIKYTQFTAGKYKGGVSPFLPDDDAKIANKQQKLITVHKVFRDVVKHYRPAVDIDQVGEGDHYNGFEALQLKLVDSLKTSSAYIADLINVRKIPTFCIKSEASSDKYFKILKYFTG